MRARRQARANDRRAFGDARLAALRAGLQLTADQQPLWPPVENALRDLGEARHALHRGRRAMSTGAAGDATARLKERSRRLIAMGQAVGTLANTAAPLLASLSPEQKGRLPVLLRGVGPRRIVADAFAIDMDRGERRRGGPDADGRGLGPREMDRRETGERDERRGGGWHHRFERFGAGRYDPDEGGRPGRDHGIRRYRHGDEERG